MLKNLFTLCLLNLMVSPLWAAERTGQARLFLGSTQVSPSQLNTELAAQGLKKVDLNNQLGMEVTFPLNDTISYGLRYNRRLISQDELNSDPTTDYKVQVDQDVMAGVLRINALKHDFVRLDAVLGIGGSNTEYKIKTATQDGSLTKKGTPAAALYTTAGVSLSLGAGKYFFVVEGGYEQNKVDGFDKSGTMNSNVDTLDFTGGYFSLGFMFDGIPIFTK